MSIKRLSDENARARVGFFGIDRGIDNTKLVGSVFTVPRAEFYRLMAEGKVSMGHEPTDQYDQYSWDGKHYRRWLSIPGVEARWDGGDPGDEDDGR